MIVNKLVFCSELEAHSRKINSLYFSANNRFLASGSKDKTLKLWALTTGKLISTIDHPEKIQAVTYSRDRVLVTGCNKGNIRLFKPQSKLSLSTYL